MKVRKPYQSQLRQEHMEQTHDLILEGLIKTMARGGVTWSIPDVAREAGVSVPTVYRYFRTKKDLVSMARELYIRSEGMSDAFRMASLSELAQEIRKEGIPMRLKLIEEALAPVLPSFNEQHRLYLVRMVLLLTSSAMIRAFKDYLDLTGVEAADTVSWAILTLTLAGSPGKEATP